MVLALVGIERAIHGRVVDGVWWTLICVGTDKLDGAAAKALDAGTPFGVQLDSLADLLSFGVAPAALLYAFYSARGWPDLALMPLSAVWVVAVALRLARFNVAAAAGASAHYLGTPSTMAAGILLTAFLTAIKYDHAVDDVPILMVGGAVSMLSSLRVPRIGKTRHVATTVILFSLMGIGVIFGAVRVMPEYLLFGGVLWLAISLRYHVQSKRSSLSDQAQA